MTINLRRARAHLENFDFKTLFVEELGWARASGRPIPLAADGEKYRLTPLAELGGMVVYVCEGASGDGLPAANLRKKIDKDVTKLSFEHILIFPDAARTKAVWSWVKREPGKAAKAREHTYTKGQPGDSLLQKLAGIAFDLGELDAEGRASIAVVSGKVAKAFDVERVTKRFYDRFKEEHAAFLKFVKGIDAADDQAWYTSVMLNRLMFIYFIQKKGFLDDDPDYLRNRLEGFKRAGRDRFYRGFLVPLFFEGFAREEGERSPEARQLLGRIPYLNGGLFLPHKIEVAHALTPGPSPVGKSTDGRGEIHIPDSVFERLFQFFDDYTWHLDDRPLRNDREINPDVLGYIFEKYINQKQMGAYYTKEDITGYICRNTVLPFLLDKLGTLRYDAVHPLPLTDIEPYVYPAVKQAEALPTETEREYAARQKRLATIRADFAAGKIAGVNDLITYNLDIERFVQDWLRALDEPLTLRAFYFECLTKLTVLDPTVGSGAFLFAAMNILEPLYEICLDKMPHWAGPKYPDFKDELARVAAHPNRRYFIYKSIIVNNLYGVDIMEEATEICKLRLFLKLVAQIDDVNHIEPLPDIDFNIRAGNSLVGYASLAEVEQAASRSLFNLNLPQKIREADVAIRAFRDLQTRIGISARALAQAKADTQAKLGEIEKELNEALKNEYGARSLEKFVESHRPFHWYVEFNQIMQDGGFDVIVGNPPYVEYSKVRTEYQIRGYQTEECGNLYAFCIERCITMLRNDGWMGLVVQQPLVSTLRMKAARDLLLQYAKIVLSSTYDDRPSKLFDGIHHARIAIFLMQRANRDSQSDLYVTRYNKWYKEERLVLFQKLVYAKSHEHISLGCFPKVGSSVEEGMIRRLMANTDQFEKWISDKETDYKVYYKITGVGHWFTITIRPPRFLRQGKESSSTREQYICFRDRKTRDRAFALLNSSLFFWFYQVRTNCRDFNPSDYRMFPVAPTLENEDFAKLASSLQQALDSTSTFINVSHSLTGSIQVEQFSPRECKPIIDEIDRVLARHYGFTDEELDFIINYDIKYRIGKEE